MNPLRLAVVFLVVALVAAFVGFGAVEGLAWEGAKILFFIFLILAVLSFLGAGTGADRSGGDGERPFAGDGPREGQGARQ
ncbi:MAG TPA: DUF1328 domain-containing protein [Gemmataceae bacterium]|nr:DUF1328 domain-containing protein [Gemmataceae bacterium]